MPEPTADDVSVLTGDYIYYDERGGVFCRLVSVDSELCSHNYEVYDAHVDPTDPDTEPYHTSDDIESAQYILLDEGVSDPVTYIETFIRDLMRVFSTGGDGLSYSEKRSLQYASTQVAIVDVGDDE